MVEQERWIIVGLGNPGRQYAKHRHNVGFRCVDRLAKGHDLVFGKRKGNAHLAIGEMSGRSVVLAKPQTYMNDSGAAVAAITSFFKVPLARLMVIFDELDLSLGSIRIRPTGGSGGHRGMASVIRSLGANDFPRVRVGIGRPPGRMDPASYVLQAFGDAERTIIDDVCSTVGRAVECWLADGIEAAMTRFNRTWHDDLQ